MDLASIEENSPTAPAPNDAAAHQEATGTVPVEYFCGIGPFKPKCLQVFRKPKFFTFLVCCNGVVVGALNTGLLASSLSTLGRRYQLTDTQIGLMPSFFEIALLVTIIFVSYFGGKGHKPRWLGVSLLITGVAPVIFVLPEFVFGPYFPNLESLNFTVSNNLETCADGVDFTPDCEATGQNRNALAFFYIGNFVLGIGAASLFTIAPSYIDDIVRPKYVSIHIGLAFMFLIFGGAAGFALGAACLTLYVDFWRDTRIPLQPTSPAWVGAWWLGFLLLAVLAWILAVPFLMFPRVLPGSHLVKAEREKEMAQKYSARNTSADENKNFLTKLASFPRHALQVVTTPSWVFLTIAIMFVVFLQEGISAFVAKLFESQFSLTPTFANIIVACTTLPMGSLGVITGAVIVHRRKAHTVALIHWILALCTLLPLLGLFIHCPSVNLAGVSVPFADGSILPDSIGPTVSSCNADCNCTSSIYEPVCGSDNVTYFSPCAAGCDVTFNINDLESAVFENCSCVAANLHLRLSAGDNTAGTTLTEEELLLNSTATLGTCDSGCVLLGPFIALLVVFLFFLFSLEIPTIVITLRCVADEQRTLALGMQAFSFRLLGNIPGPIVFGAIFEAACLYFRYDVPCQTKGNCWAYDNFQLSWSIAVTVFIGMSLYVVFSFLTWLSYPKTNASEGDSRLTSNGKPHG